MTYPGAFPSSATFPGGGLSAAALTALPGTWALDGLVFGSGDAEGCWWIVRSSNGWHNPPKPKVQRIVKSSSPGSFRAANYRDERIITLTGATKAPTVAARLDAEDRLAALCAYPAGLYTLTVTDQTGFPRTADVELDGSIDVKLPPDRKWFDWQLTLAAPDPLKYDATWQRPQSKLITPATSGADFSGTGLSYAASGIDWGTPAVYGVSQVANFGSARTYPLFEVAGPCVTPAIRDVDTGLVIVYAGVLGVGDVITINCSDFAARGFPPRSCFFNGVRNDRVLLSVPQEWPSVGPGEVHNFQIAANGTTAAELTVYLRSAWY